MSLLKIINLDNSDQYFYIDKNNALKLEIAFNISEKGKEWKELGDTLYNFSINENLKQFKINSKKFHFLRNLANEKDIKKITHKSKKI